MRIFGWELIVISPAVQRAAAEAMATYTWPERATPELYLASCRAGNHDEYVGTRGRGVAWIYCRRQCGYQRIEKVAA